MRQTDDDNFEIINGKKCLRDGGRLRVRTAFMDSVQRSVRQAFGDQRPRIVDSDGGTLGLHKPGHRFANDAAAIKAVHAVKDAYDEYESWVTSQWQGLNPKRVRDGRPGDPCTCKGEDYPDYFLLRRSRPPRRRRRLRARRPHRRRSPPQARAIPRPERSRGRQRRRRMERGLRPPERH
jgi:hypothetical protein